VTSLCRRYPSPTVARIFFHRCLRQELELACSPPAAGKEGEEGGSADLAILAQIFGCLPAKVAHEGFATALLLIASESSLLPDVSLATPDPPSEPYPDPASSPHLPSPPVAPPPP
jgi:hypothetical protein